VLSIVSSTTVGDFKDLCNLLMVSKGLQAAIISKGGNSRCKLKFQTQGSNLARTGSFGYWVSKYHMLVKQLSFAAPNSNDQLIVDAHATAISQSLHPPLQLWSLVYHTLKAVEVAAADKLAAPESPEGCINQLQH